MLGSGLVVYSSPFLVEIRVLFSFIEVPGWHMFACLIPTGLLAGTSFSPGPDPSASQGGWQWWERTYLLSAGPFFIWTKCIGLFPSVGFGYQVVCWNDSRSQPEFCHISDTCMRQKAQEQSYNLSLSAQGRPSSALGHVDKYLQERLTPDRYHSISKEDWPRPIRSMARGWRATWGGCKCCISWSSWWWCQYLQMWNFCLCP